MMFATFNGNPYTIIVACYSLTNASDEIDITTFYNESYISLSDTFPNTTFSSSVVTLMQIEIKTEIINFVYTTC